MGPQSTIRRKARRLIPLAAALLLAALVAIPSSGIALAQTPPGNGIVLVNADRELGGAQEGRRVRRPPRLRPRDR